MKLVDCDKNCCGCEACTDICPVNAIQMKEDSDGFAYPKIDYGKCIHCGLCITQCGYRNIRGSSLKETYAAVSECTDLDRSSSGGSAAAFASAVIEEGGAVYGAALVQHEHMLSVQHLRVTQRDELDLLYGSKYVQSSMTGIYPQIKKDVQSGVKVLFIGTPCQVAGVRGYLGNEYQNLYYIDIVCHGVPNIRFFNSYLEYLEKKTNCRVQEYQFRNKSQGWKLYGRMTLQDNEGKIITKYFEPEGSSYYDLFLQGYSYRENCYSCPYASDHRTGDLTIGDYWGVEVVQPEILQEYGGQFNFAKGISCLVVNNRHGKELLDESRNRIRLLQSDYEKISKYNGQLRHPSIAPKDRDLILDLYHQKGYEGIERWHTRILLKRKIKRNMKAAVPKPVKKVFRNVIEGDWGRKEKKN